MSRGARALVMDLASRGREAGTPGAQMARRSVESFLTELGYTVQQQEFNFNAGVYRVLPAAGAVLAVVSVAELFLLRRAAPGTGLAALILLAAVVALVTAYFLSGTRGSGFDRVDANLIATRPGVPVSCWLVAHLDTKAQAQSMAGRLVGLWVTVLAVTALLAAVVVRLYRPVPSALAAAVGVLGCVAGVLLSRGRLSGTSPGARDNASGLLALLTAAELSPDAAIGLIITGAEEFGLVGARALARERPELFAGTLVVNVDTVDDEGTTYVVTHGPESADLASRAISRLKGLSPLVRERRLPIGIMVDSLPLSRVARQSITVGRLTWATLRRVHTARDDVNGYHLVTAERLGERLALPI